MKPNFALSLSFDGIRLMHRSGTGWTIVGDVPLDSSDLSGELAMLRKTALALDPAGMRTKVLLPNDQIKYLALDSTRTTEDEVRAALDGVTPYPVADLVYDFVKGAGRTYIAAVARETLDEAEAFATEHRFAPVSFAGVPEEFTFLGESFFGQTKAARTLLPAGETVQRDPSPVRIQGKPARAAAAPAAVVSPVNLVPPVALAPPPPVESVVAAPEVIEPASPDIVTPPDDAPTIPEVADPVVATVPMADIPLLVLEPAEPVPPVATPPVPDASTASETPPPVVPPPVPDANPVPDEAPVFASRARPLRALADDPLLTTAAIVTATPLVAPAKPAPILPSVDRPGPDDARVEPVFSRRSGTLPATPLPMAAQPIPTTEPVQKPLAVPVARDIAGPPMAAQAIVGRVTIDSVGLTQRSGTVPRAGTSTAPVPFAAPPVTGLSGAARPETTVAASIAPIRPAPPAAVPISPAGTFTPGLSGGQGAVPVQKPTANVVPLRPPAIPADALTRAPTDQAAMVKSAARPSRGKPRFMGLILTVILLLAMAAVATWAAVSDQGLSRWFGDQTDDSQVAGATTGAVAVPVAIPLPQPDTDTTAAATPDPVDIVVPEEDIPENAVTATDPVPTADIPPPDAVAAAAAAAAVATAIAGLAQDTDPATAPTDAAMLAADTAASPSLADPATGTQTAAADVAADSGAVVSAEEADRFYAATGVWLRAPRLPLTPEGEVLDDLYTAALDNTPVAGPDPSLPALGPDPGLVVQMNPPAPGTQFPRDAQGFFLATVEGTLTPDGLMIFAGQPSLVPPTRPGTVAPVLASAVADADALPDAGPDGTALAAADILALTAPESPAAFAPSKRPQARPDTAVAAIPETTPETLPDGTLPNGTATLLSPDVDPATAGAVSLAGVRPPVRPDGIVPDGVVPAEPVTALAAYDGLRPSTRPDGLTPDGTTSSPAELIEEIPEAAPDLDPTEALSATLASIVQDAADPLAGATAQAVAVARRPGARPTNFSRVVQQQTTTAARAQPAAAAVASAAPTSNGTAEEQAETQPDVVSSANAAPSGAVPGGVAQAATYENVMALREINLIGVYGRPNERRALVRLSNGRYVRVSVGDSLDGGQVAAISDSALNYVKRGRTVTLEIPAP